MSSPVVRDEVTFTSDGTPCTGWLFRPQSSGPVPCVVMAHGLGGIRSAVLPAFAERFATAGIAALVFDYRCWGTSGGEPRGLIDITGQRRDYHAAIAYAREHPAIDPGRVAVWGTSFSGGHALAVAVADPAVAAVVIQNPSVDGRASAALAARHAGAVRTVALLAHAVRDETRRRTRRPPHRIPLAGPPGSTALITTPDGVEGYRALLPADRRGWVPDVPARVVLRLRRDRPALAARRIDRPVMICICSEDRIAPVGPARRLAEWVDAEVREYPIEHFDIFHPPWVDTAANDQAAFLVRTLLRPPTV